ncbi:MAG: ribosome maturation factor RimM [Gammaproteobacteria bacterium]|nr:ribosome maturation factor RimM [Gammaproteobacteria bacterium]
MATSEEFVPVGKVSGVFGVKGWMKIFSFTEPRKNILSYSPIYMSRKGEWVEMKVSGGRVQGKGVVLGLVDVTDPDQVLPLIGSELAIKRSQLKPTARDEFYWSQLIGLTVTNLNDETLGQVDSLLETGAHDVLLVKDKEHKTEQLIPFVMEDIVQRVDLDKGLIQVDWELDY